MPAGMSPSSGNHLSQVQAVLRIPWDFPGYPGMSQLQLVWQEYLYPGPAMMSQALEITCPRSKPSQWDIPGYPMFYWQSLAPCPSSGQILPQLGIWKRFIRSLWGVDRGSLSWWSGRGLLEVYPLWTAATLVLYHKNFPESAPIAERKWYIVHHQVQY